MAFAVYPFGASKEHDEGRERTEAALEETTTNSITGKAGVPFILVRWSSERERERKNIAQVA